MLLGILLSVQLCLASCGGAAAQGSPRDPDEQHPIPSPSVQPTPIPGPMLAQGNPSALPGILMVADRGNNRIIELDPRGNIVWQFPPAGYQGAIPWDQPDDAFYSPDGHEITTNEEFEHTIQVIDRSSREVTWSYGTPYKPGSGPDHVNGPDDAYQLPDGRVVTADIKNCRILFISPDHTTTQIGHTGVCRHDPAHGYLASPNGDAPDATYQHLVVTEIGGSWVDVYSLADLSLEYSFHSPAAYPSDAEMQPDGSFILTDYVSPGAIYRIDRSGKVLWKYSDGLDHPSIALGLPNGFVAISDDFGDRVMIVDPSTNQIAWQYGVKNVPGVTPGYLNTTDGLDFRLNTSH